ncbi:MAG TPA: hypothetical protein ENN87_05390, partial [Phycisphaerales bacterium]|nr:hypothetical protein [Phycisphaerales bacterium]
TQRDPTSAGALLNEAYDYPGQDDKWLGDIEPVYDTRGRDDITLHEVGWRHLSDVYYDVPGVYHRPPNGPDPMYGIGFYAYEGLTRREVLYPPGNETWADADGDGVWDSLWVRVPGLVAADGRPIYAAVRIVDNCGMLNLNAAHSLSPDSEGYYLSAVDYEPFLRGSDWNDVTRRDNLRRARHVDGYLPDFTGYTPREFHDKVLMRFENPHAYLLAPEWRLFEIGDELEIRNRFLLTSSVQARFETYPVAHYTFDAKGGPYPALAVPRRTSVDFYAWKVRVNPDNFAASEPPDPDDYKYDRRHVCTFYSFDRNIRSGVCPLLHAWDVANRRWVAREHAHLFMPPHGTTASVAWDFLKPTDHPIPQVQADLQKRQRQQILWLLYGFRAYFLRAYLLDQESAPPGTLIVIPAEERKKAARKSAQIVANLIDFMDSKDTPGIFPGQANAGGIDEVTRIDRTVVRGLIQQVTGMDLESDPDYAFGLADDDQVYGYERQPFITQIYCTFNGLLGGIQDFAVELANPYEDPLDLSRFRLRIGDKVYSISPGKTVDGATAQGASKFVLDNNPGISVHPDVDASRERQRLIPFDRNITGNDAIELQRQVPGPTGPVWLTVDQVKSEHLRLILSDGAHSLLRDDSTDAAGGTRMDWRLANAELWEHLEPSNPNYATTRLGTTNNIDLSDKGEGYQLPVANAWTAAGQWYGTEWLAMDPWPYSTLGRFGKVPWIGSDVYDPDEGEPNPITMKIGLAAAEGDVRYDIDAAPELLGYVGFVSRPEGRLPGRININTATKEVIRAAIPRNDEWVPDVNDLAQWIVERRKSTPFKNLADLLDVEGFRRFMDPNNVGPSGADPAVEDDFEERDWILSRLSNIFTVRSDVFTAYIAVRVGAPSRDSAGTPADMRDDIIDNAAHRRVIAIFDRSRVADPADRPRLVALHPVPEAR